MSAGPPEAGDATRAAFIGACLLDVAVRKPGNVSHASPGHGMAAAQFEGSARAAAGPLCRAGARIGARIEAAVAATWAVAGCNTNLGILLLCAPIAAAAEMAPARGDPRAWRLAIERVLAGLDRVDAEAAFRAIVQANPGGLGQAAAADVHEPPRVTLREAMALAAPRDAIARLYRDGYDDLFAIGVAALGAAFALPDVNARGPAVPDAATVAAVQRCHLAFLAATPDTHIVRKHGAAVAESVRRSAVPWHARAVAGEPLDSDPRFAAWDEALKASAINPGTSADLTVAAMMLAALAGRSGVAEKRDNVFQI